MMYKPNPPASQMQDTRSMKANPNQIIVIHSKNQNHNFGINQAELMMKMNSIENKMNSMSGGQYIQGLNVGKLNGNGSSRVQ